MQRLRTETGFGPWQAHAWNAPDCLAVHTGVEFCVPEALAKKQNEQLTQYRAAAGAPDGAAGAWERRCDEYEEKVQALEQRLASLAGVAGLWGCFFFSLVKLAHHIGFDFESQWVCEGSLPL